MLIIQCLGRLGKTHSSGTKAKISAAKGVTIYVYNADKSTLVYSFPSANKAGEFFNSNHLTIKKYALNGKIFQKKWVLSTIFKKVDPEE